MQDYFKSHKTRSMTSGRWWFISFTPGSFSLNIILNDFSSVSGIKKILKRSCSLRGSNPDMLLNSTAHQLLSTATTQLTSNILIPCPWISNCLASHGPIHIFVKHIGLITSSCIQIPNPYSFFTMKM